MSLRAADANTPLSSDTQSLSRLKRAAREGSPEATRDVAEQFEALFMQLALKQMRSASLAGIGGKGPFDSEQSQFYRELFDRQLALELAKDGDLGMADMIAKSLGGEKTTRIPQPDLSSVPTLSIPTIPNGIETLSRAEGRGSVRNDNATALSGTGAVSNGFYKPSTPEAFVQHMWPHAQRAAARLGQSPEILIAQAALETGWGRSVPQASDGRSSHNLFGIKADRGWKGPRVVNSTLEFIGGVAERRRDGFRAYGSYAESFDDYVDFLHRNPRYKNALAQRNDSSAYIREIHRAGYATDPRYAAKVESILNGPVLEKALGTLKFAGEPPIPSTQG